MYLYEQDGPRATAGRTGHSPVLARLLAITRRHCTVPRSPAQPVAASLPVCDGAGFEDRLHASLATLGRDTTRSAGVTAWGRVPLRALERKREQRASPGPNGGLVGWIEFDTLEAAEPGQAERATDELRAIVRDAVDVAGGGDGFVGRYGAESFAWARLGAMPLEQAVALADAMLESLSAPAQLAGVQRNLQPSLGFTYFPEDGTSPAMLLSRACAAMRRARHYRMGYAFYSPILDAAFAFPAGAACNPARGARRAQAGGAANVAVA
ncbi:MAG: hypothetical protein ROZ64_07530 [Burkholderiaceae bacterium]|jgi:hypothetical protein|nr:hypothetical protein [Burkholderiaceae bacterium]